MIKDNKGNLVTKVYGVEVTIDKYRVNFREEKIDGYHWLSIPIVAYEMIYIEYLKEQGYTIKKIKEEKK